MKISKFIIENFKGIRNLEISLGDERRIYTLIGLNESGKTSVLEALNIFSNEIPIEERHKYIPKSEKFSFNGSIKIIAVLTLNDKDKKDIIQFLVTQKYSNINVGTNIRVERIYNFKNSTPTTFQKLWTITLKGNKANSRKQKDIYTDDIEVWRQTVRYIEETIFPKIIYYPNFLFDFPERIYLENYKGDTLEFQKFRDVVQDILFTLDSNLNIEKDILERLKQSSSDNEEILDLLLAKMSNKVSQIVFSAWGKLFNRGNKEIIIKPGKELINDKIEYYLQFKLKEGGDQFFISERSLGFKWFFSFLLFTGLRKNRVSDKSEVLFLLDEPASNLHPTAQKNLLKTFEEIMSKSSLIYTTHSHHLINPEWLNGMYIVKNNAVDYNNDFNYDSSVTDITITPYKQFIASYPNQTEYFQPILDTLDYQPGLIEKVPSIIIVEGKNDFYTLRYFCKVIFKSYDELSFYPAGGASSDEQVLRLYISWNRDFLLLKDADKAGKKAIENYKKIFPIYTENKMFTLNDINPIFDNMSMEDLFSENDKLLIIQNIDKDETKYNKSKFNLSIQSLLQENKVIELSTSTIENFKSILDFFATKLSISLD